MAGSIFLVVLVIFAIVIITSWIKVVPQSEAYVVERLGTYRATFETGLHFLLPMLDRVAKKVNLKEQVVDFKPQPVITKDNVTMQIDTVVFFLISDPKLYTYGVENPISAIENLTATTLRNIIGEMELDETLTSREVINTKMRASLDQATDPWGIKVTLQCKVVLSYIYKNQRFAYSVTDLTPVSYGAGVFIRDRKKLFV